MTGLKNSTERFHSRLDEAEERISKLNRLSEITWSDKQKDKRMKKAYRICGTPSSKPIYLGWGSFRRSRK
jgi:hypothetical protein